MTKRYCLCSWGLGVQSPGRGPGAKPSEDLEILHFTVPR